MGEWYGQFENGGAVVKGAANERRDKVVYAFTPDEDCVSLKHICTCSQKGALAFEGLYQVRCRPCQDVAQGRFAYARFRKIGMFFLRVPDHSGEMSYQLLGC
jgi:hypothetical protein